MGKVTMRHMDYSSMDICILRRFFSPNGQNDDFYGWNDLNEPSVRDVPEVD